MVFIFLLLFAQGQAITQSAQAHAPRFEVASIRQGDALGQPEISNSNGRSHARNATLKAIMATAYQVPAFQISGGPSWVDSERFDIEARAEDASAGYIQLRLMMQSLLEERFRLRLHRETRTAPVFILVQSKGGAKIRQSSDQTSPDQTAPPKSAADAPPRGSVLLGHGLLVANAASMQVLAKVLAPSLDRPVLNETNLNGRFDMRLEWTPEFQPTGDLPGLFTALREQLGLELKPGHGPVEFLIIDSVQKPSPN